ncbi:MAG: hypothetical protein ACTSVI_06250 [Promethearchaeota archaeon]
MPQGRRCKNYFKTFSFKEPLSIFISSSLHFFITHGKKESSFFNEATWCFTREVTR